MIETIVAVLILLVMVLFVGRTLVERPATKKKERDVTHQVHVQIEMDLVPKEAKERVASLEREVFEKADQAKRIAEHETEIIMLQDLASPPVSEDLGPVVASPEDTAQIKAISRKVERVRRLSEGNL